MFITATFEVVEQTLFVRSDLRDIARNERRAKRNHGHITLNTNATIATRLRRNRRQARLVALGVTVDEVAAPMLTTLPTTDPRPSHPSLIRNSRIDEGVEDVGHEIGDQNEEGDEDRHPHDQGVVVVGRRFGTE